MAKRKSWFERCVERVYSAGGAYDPDAVCGALLRDKRRRGQGENPTYGESRATRRSRRPRGKKPGCGCRH